MCVCVLMQIYLDTQTQKLLTPNKQIEWNSLSDGVRWSTLSKIHCSEEASGVMVKNTPNSIFSAIITGYSDTVLVWTTH